MSIQNGYTIWARKTSESEIFLEKPDKWFKIWFYIVGRVNHKENGKFERGQGWFTYQELANITRPKSTKAVVDRVMRWLRSEQMLTTLKTTKGVLITVNNYGYYQDQKNYADDTRKHTQTISRRQPDDTINKNEERNMKKNNTIEGLTAEDFKEIAEKYKTSVVFVESVYDELVIYCGSKGKKYDNYKLALMGWVRRKVEENPANKTQNILKPITKKEREILDLARDKQAQINYFKQQGYDTSSLI